MSLYNCDTNWLVLKNHQSHPVGNREKVQVLLISTKEHRNNGLKIDDLIIRNSDYINKFYM
jgi:hypothetical protein